MHYLQDVCEAGFVVDIPEEPFFAPECASSNMWEALNEADVLVLSVARLPSVSVTMPRASCGST